MFLLGEDIADPGASGPTAGLSTKYGHDRVLDTPISEAAIVGAAIGAAIDGMLPVAEIMIMDFIGIAADQLINNAAKLALHDCRPDHRADHRPHPGLCGIGHRRNAFAEPGGVVHAHPGHEGDRALHPAGRQRAYWLRRFSTRTRACSSKPFGCRARRGWFRSIRTSAIPLGQADVKRPGKDVTLISYGRAVHDALAAAETLADPGCQRRGRRPADPGPARRRHHRRIGAPHPPGRHRSRRSAIRRPGSRGRRDPAG